jgi:hypothetical protein
MAQQRVIGERKVPHEDGKGKGRRSEERGIATTLIMIMPNALEEEPNDSSKSESICT